ncbi:hypothetical protein [Roseateles sp. LKC17W]|uniref:Uncharacterized protein n=1 Tax=Pelomonas margarita TaxID=3299031 RepID=A0ABW7FFL9_9BURK
MKLSIEIHRSPQWTMLAAGFVDRRVGLVIGPIAISLRAERSRPFIDY